MKFESVFLVIGPGLVVAFVLLVGGIGKLANLREFRKLVEAYDLLPRSALRPFSLALPVCEVAVGSAVLVNRLRSAAGLLAAGLFAIFTAAIVVNLLRGRRELPCGCFGSKSRPISWQLAARNFVLLGLALLSAGRLVVFSLLLPTVYTVIISVQSLRRSKRVPHKDTGKPASSNPILKASSSPRIVSTWGS